MRLGISSAALPDADLDALIDAAAARGLSTIELRAGDGHGVKECCAASARRCMSAQGIDIAGYHTAEDVDVAGLVRVSEALAAPVLIAASESLGPQLARVRRITDAGGAALAVVAGPAASWLDDVVRAGIGYAWQIDAAQTNLAADTNAVLTRAAAGLRCIRFIGGGPETAMQGGHGVGALMGRLALAGYDGPLILAPSSTRYRVAWASWLGRRGGWGCGSRTDGGSVIPLVAANGGGT